MRLKFLREIHKLTQTELADKLGISRLNYNRYELEKVEPDLTTLIKIAKFYNVTLDYICENETNNILDLSILPMIKKKNIDMMLGLIEKNDYRLNGYLSRILDEQNQK